MVSVDGHECDDEVGGGAEHGGQGRQDVHVHVDGGRVPVAFVRLCQGDQMSLWKNSPKM
jgi:hypothetical protein